MYLQRHLTPPEARALCCAARFPASAVAASTSATTPPARWQFHVVGMTDVDDRGIEGMELAFEDWLKGTGGPQAGHQGPAR